MNGRRLATCSSGAGWRGDGAGHPGLSNDRLVTIATWVETEAARRSALWRELLARGGARRLSPKDDIEARGLYRGQAGIFADMKAEWARDGPGPVALTLVHTGTSYDDDLTDEGLLYHYPSTNRRGAHDSNEITAVKTAQALGLPVFVISPEPGAASLRRVRLGYVGEHDDAQRVFVVTFFDEPLPLPRPSELPADDRALILFEQLPTRTTRLVAERPNQLRFRIHVLQRYGPRCAFCDIDSEHLVQAAHIAPKSLGGIDEAANGLPLCANHHLAFDRFLVIVDPDTQRLSYAPGTDAEALRITREALTHLPQRPSPRALDALYRTRAAQKAMSRWSRPGDDRDDA
ncbi:HNH endonuclease [Frigoribacterium sp. CFBP 8754]|uniref:HNH endonuclease n=1 Tax=Frigoribacterium sp. CFBP 8754 TaxID=2775290 RepID=UPI00177B8055|nr:HNH endonuclease [Frigoribacterium sp. CFBP 8754]MBD8659807.1 HNH endonuclease [Frigoribacterium sp. CFBP 8754]